MPYILEVQKFNHVGQNGKFIHIGYMDKSFKTKQEASNCYDRHNAHMRSLNAHNTWISDWDPVIWLRYRVRKYNTEYCIITPFNEKHTK